MCVCLRVCEYVCVRVRVSKSFSLRCAKGCECACAVGGGVGAGGAGRNGPVTNRLHDRSWHADAARLQRALLSRACRRGLRRPPRGWPQSGGRTLGLLSVCSAAVRCSLDVFDQRHRCNAHTHTHTYAYTHIHTPTNVPMFLECVKCSIRVTAVLPALLRRRQFLDTHQHTPTLVVQEAHHRLI